MTELTPYICVADARAAIEWYVAALGAEVTYDPIVMDDGRVGHCELAIGGARWMMSDEFDSAGVAAPDPDRGSAVSLHLTVTDARRARGGLRRPVRSPLVPEPAGPELTQNRSTRRIRPGPLVRRDPPDTRRPQAAVRASDRDR